MSKSPSYKPGFDALEDRQMPSVAPVPRLEGFRDPTATIRVLDEAQPNIVGVTRQGISNITNGFGATAMADNWAASSMINGQEQVLPFNDRRDFAVETRNVAPKFSFQAAGNSALKITWENMPAGYRVNMGGYYDHTLGSTDGTVTLGLPWSMYDVGCPIDLRLPNNTILSSGFSCHIRGGDFYNGPPAPASKTFTNLSWNRTFQPDDVVFMNAKQLAGFDTTLPGGLVWKKDEVVLHPGSNEDAVLTWTSPATGTASIKALLQDKKAGLGDGVTYTVELVNSEKEDVTTISQGIIGDGGSKEILEGSLTVAVNAGDKIRLIISAKGTTGDATNAKWDSISTSMEVKLTEAEKTYEKVTVAPSIQFRTINDGQTVFVDYRNMPAGMSVRIMKRGLEWGDGDWRKTEVPLPEGSGSRWVTFQHWGSDNPLYPVDIYVIDSNSDNEPIEEKKLTFMFDDRNPAGPFTTLPLNRVFFGSRAHDVLKDPALIESETDFAEELAVSAYLQYRTNPPARDWTDGKIFDQVAKARQFGALSQSDLMNEPLNGNGGLYKILIPTSTTKYERHTILTDGSATIERVLYVKEDGLHKMPQEYYERLSNGGIATKPNVPGYIILDLRLTGHIARSSLQGDTLAEIQLPLGQHVIGGIERITPQPTDQPGWRDMILDIQQGPSAVLNPGTTVCVFAQLNGAGSEGGPITLRAYCTYDGNIANAQPQYISTTNFGANQRKTVFFNMHAPLPGPSSDARGIITMEIEYPDGRKEIIANRITRALGIDEVEQAAAMKANKAAYAKMPMFAADGRTVIGMGGNLFKDQPTLALQYMQQNGNNPVAGSDDGYDTALYTMSVSGVGGADTPPANLATLQRALSRYSDGLSVPGVNARTETLMGKIILGAIDKILANPSISSQQPIFRDLSEITGIPELKIARATRLMAINIPQDQYNRNCPSAEQSKAQLIELFSYAGFNSAFGNNQGSPLPGVISLHVGKPDYTLADQDIVVRFNMAASLNGYETLKLQVRKSNGNIVSVPVFSSGSSGAMYAKIPVQQILTSINATSPQHVSLRLSVTKNGQTYTKESIGFIVEAGAVLDLSTSENSERKSAEDKILTQLASNFPLLNPELRRWTIGSGYHDADEYFAADFNDLGSGDSDRGDSVLAIQDGVIRIGGSGSYTGNMEGDLKIGVVVIEHQKAVGANLAWKSIYMHMPIFSTERFTGNGKRIFEVRHENNVIEIWDGKAVKAGNEIGYVGGRMGVNADGSYKEGTNNAHLHFLMKYAGIAIDMRKGVFEAGLNKVEAFDAGVDGDSDTTNDARTIEVTWNDSVNTWVTDDLKLVYDRREQLPPSPGLTTNSYWLAWEEGKTIDHMKRVAFDKQSSSWYQVNSAVNDWTLDEQGKRIKWIKSNNIFTFLPEEL